ncbi:DUF1127 domain-containing protein [Paracoccus tegillarcae]|uniref:YjiS-like domain-containing protein n=1 Tax=Paracoccus tegillarcae TaxID=1529068 RepID=A0A2K9EJ51_9RHOB|nr:DUF1127 domain-containing protein [Paracoccus tegillarcae]AUH34409.1 hypothetical protein CUV01_14340 [Paracoccus tegillarcae]
MAYRSTAMARVVTGTGIIPRPNWLERILTAFDVRKTRADLSRLTDEQLHDIGITREQAEDEAKRTMWDAPEYFRARS